VVLNLQPLELRLIDFGNSMPVEDQMRFTEKGTPGYSPSSVNWVAGDWRWDAWSLGAMIVEMRATEAFQKTRNGRHTMRLA